MAKRRSSTIAARAESGRIDLDPTFRAETVGRLWTSPVENAEWEMNRRGIPLALVQAVMEPRNNDWLDESRPGRWIYQSRLRFEDGKMYLLRVVVDENEQLLAIITVPDQQD